MILQTAYSLDDILLEPRKSDINSRLDTDVSSNISTNFRLNAPLLSTNMSTITELDMMVAMSSVGGAGALHRFLNAEQRLYIVSEAKKKEVYPIIASIGVGNKELDVAKELVKCGANIILIDVAHGHSQQVIEQLNSLKKASLGYNFDVIVGNIATEDAANDFLALGADGLRVGIGGGSRCLTRTVTGHGVPNLTAIKSVVYARDNYFHHSKKYVPVIIDGGIKNSGDITKALYFGADVACLGNLLSGADECPGELVENGEHKFKKFYGMASKEAQDTHRGGMKSGTAVEGFSELVPYKGSVLPIVENLVGGVRSGLTYSGAKDIKQLREKGRPMLLTSAGRMESKL